MIYYNQYNDEIGYTILNTKDGIAKSYPYRSLAKWGLLSPSGYKELTTAIKY